MLAGIYHTRIWGEVGFYQAIKEEKTIYLEAFENYQKKSTRNRYMVQSNQGATWLSIPLRKGKNNQQGIMDTTIAYDEDWVTNHLRTLAQSYKQAPFTEYYLPYIEELYHNHYESLYELNKASIQLVLQWLRWDNEIADTIDYVGSNPLPHIPFKSYQQNYNPQVAFIPNCCILDLLFCTGPESVYYL